MNRKTILAIVMTISLSLTGCTFDIKEGDRMYTKPEDRLSVW